MIEPLPESTANILGFKMSGKLHDADYKLFVPIVETAIKAQGKVRLLARFEDFHGWDLHAMWDDTKFATQHCRDVERIALEGYPGLLAHEIIGRRSYKNDASPERLLARKDIIEALEQGRTRLGLRIKLTPAQAGELVADSSGDRLDAVLCLMQAAWASVQPRWGQPEGVDGVEGWITSA